MKFDTVKSLVLLATVGAVGFVAYRAYKTGSDAASSIGDTINNAYETVRYSIEQGVANVAGAWNNNIAGPFQYGQDWANGVAAPLTEKQRLYGDYAYTGIDPATGQLVTEGEWYGNATARSYEAGLIVRPAATSNNGAAFGIYPSAFGSTSIYQATQADVRRVDKALGY